MKDIHGLAGYFAGIEPGRFKIVLDALYRLLPSGIDESSDADMAAVYNAIDQYAARFGCAFVLVHHASEGIQANKSVMDVGAGAGAQSRATDAHVVLRPHEEEGCVVLDAVVRSWAPVDPFVIRWDFPVWKPAPELDPTQLRQESRRRPPPGTGRAGGRQGGRAVDAHPLRQDVRDPSPADEGAASRPRVAPGPVPAQSDAAAPAGRAGRAGPPLGSTSPNRSRNLMAPEYLSLARARTPLD